MAATPRVLEIRLSFFFVKCLGTLEVSRDNIRMCTHKALYLSNPIWPPSFDQVAFQTPCRADILAGREFVFWTEIFERRLINNQRFKPTRFSTPTITSTSDTPAPTTHPLFSGKKKKSSDAIQHKNLLMWPTNLDRKRPFWSSLSQFQKRIFSRPKCPRERVLMCPIRRFRKVLSVSKKKPRHVSKYRGLTIYTT